MAFDRRPDAHDHDDDHDHDHEHDHHHHHDHDHDHDHDHEHDHGDDHDEDGYYDDPEGDPEAIIYDEGASAIGRRRHATIVMTFAAITFLASLVVLAGYLGTSDDLLDVVDVLEFTTWIWIFSGLLAAFFVWLLILVFVSPQREPAYDDEEDIEDDGAAWEETPMLPESDTIGLRCTRCKHVFTVTDTGERPLYHMCPNCSARGAFDDRPTGAPLGGGESPT